MNNVQYFLTKSESRSTWSFVDWFGDSSFSGSIQFTMDLGRSRTSHEDILSTESNGGMAPSRDEDNEQMEFSQ